MNDTGFYQTVAWTLFGFLAGVVAGGYLTLRLRTGQPHRATRDGMFGATWQRGDVDMTPPPPKETYVRRELINGAPDVEELAFFDGRTITFTIPTATGQRDVTFKATSVAKFLRPDVPDKKSWRGDNTERGQIMRVARHFGWLYPNGNSYVWANFLASRERRLRVLKGWTER